MPADRQPALDQVGRQVGAEGGPDRRHHHRREVRSGRVADQADAVRVEAQPVAVAVQPAWARSIWRTISSIGVAGASP